MNVAPPISVDMLETIHRIWSKF